MPPNLEDLSDEEQYKAYWLSEHLFKEGIEGIHFTDRMREYLENEGEETLERKVNAKLKKRNF